MGIFSFCTLSVYRLLKHLNHLPDNMTVVSTTFMLYVDMLLIFGVQKADTAIDLFSDVSLALYANTINHQFIPLDENIVMPPGDFNLSHCASGITVLLVAIQLILIEL